MQRASFELFVFLENSSGIHSARFAQEEGDQLRRAATAVRRNYRAARRGRSRTEFEAKLGTLFEEADECVDCLEALRDARIKKDDVLIQEARELASIFAKSVSTARKHSRRKKDFPNS